MIGREISSEENKEALEQKSKRQLEPTEVSVNGKKNYLQMEQYRVLCFITKVEIVMK